MHSKQSLSQNDFLNTARKEQRRVEVYLVNGVRLIGSIASFDQFVVMLSSPGGGMQTIYKSAISTIQVQTGVRQSGSPTANSSESTTPYLVERKRRPVTGGDGK
ncbi:host factor-I protein [Cupriavidus sp. YR651]|uniref:RNA chaperone Hfq n=1 Tax=Cupriavidus sp. YR651 TaxID=1855315 RepID=UPI00088E4BA3|nr:host factor-I protein [Cupriavidus sp. YR651]